MDFAANAATGSRSWNESSCAVNAMAKGPNGQTELLCEISLIIQNRIHSEGPADHAEDLPYPELSLSHGNSTYTSPSVLFPPKKMKGLQIFSQFYLIQIYSDIFQGLYPEQQRQMTFKGACGNCCRAWALWHPFVPFKVRNLRS
jgi:hypothetical protein